MGFNLSMYTAVFDGKKFSLKPMNQVREKLGIKANLGEGNRRIGLDHQSAVLSHLQNVHSITQLKL